MNTGTLKTVVDLDGTIQKLVLRQLSEKDLEAITDAFMEAGCNYNDEEWQPGKVFEIADEESEDCRLWTDNDERLINPLDDYNPPKVGLIGEEEYPYK